MTDDPIFYDDLKNIKTGDVITVVFNLYQIKQLKFFGGHPVHWFKIRNNLSSSLKKSGQQTAFNHTSVWTSYKGAPNSVKLQMSWTLILL